MNWSRQYLRDLLNGDDALASVYGLAQAWSSRPGRKETDLFFGLLPCQYAVHLYLNYQGDVGNGGHSQYFSNPVGAHASETLAALRELGFEEIHDVLARAVAAFPGSHVPTDWQVRNAIIEGLSDEVFVLWAGLDRELYSLDGQHWAKLLEYLRKHESEILDWNGS